MTKNMDFKALIGKIGSARVEHKVCNFFFPETQMLRRETPKLGPREGSIKCLIFDLKHGLYGAKRQNWVRAGGA